MYYAFAHFLFFWAQAKGNDLVVGHIIGDPLASLEYSLSHIFSHYAENKLDWGKASATDTEEFQTELKRSGATIADTLHAIGGGLELSQVDPSINLEETSRNSTVKNKGNKPLVQPVVYERLQATLEDWIAQIEQYLAGIDASAGATTKNGNPQFIEHIKGPMGILNFWRVRMSKLSSIVEQLKRKDVVFVTSILASLTKGNTQAAQTSPIIPLLRHWKDLDMSVTEAANEAKDNVKYLSTLEKFIEPIVHGTPLTAMDSLPALINAIKMIHTIARYFNTPVRMADLFIKVTYGLIENCKAYIRSATTGKTLWDADISTLLPRLNACLQLDELYQETYRLTKEKMASIPGGKPFDFNEQSIFGRFDLFCRRVVKLIDLFTTLSQFRELAAHKIEGMESLMGEFNDLANGLKRCGHELLDYTSNAFDRDLVEFNVNIDALEVKCQGFIDSCFESIKSVDAALDLLSKFRRVITRDALRADFDNKLTVIFAAFGRLLESIQVIYEEEKLTPPRSRNLPPVAGNITWARHLLSRIEGPMSRFEEDPFVFASKEGRRIVKTYNRVAKTLVAYEYLWTNAWIDSIETAKSGLAATLIVRHPDDGNLYVNFDAEILQLIREAKCLERLGVKIPESAQMVLLQEPKFKETYTELALILKDYSRIISKVIPVTLPLLRPAISDLEYRLKPGMITLTWTSMNIDAYKKHVREGLDKLEELVRNVNDIVESRIEKNLRIVSKTLLVFLPPDRSFTLDEFVMTQQDHVRQQAVYLHAKNVEIEAAVGDLCTLVSSYQTDPHIKPVSVDDYRRVVEHYNHFMYAALLNSAKCSLNAVKKRVAVRATTFFLYMNRPFFELDVQLQNNKVVLSPTLEEIQSAINRTAIAILGCTKRLFDWGQEEIEESARVTFFDRITNDVEIVRVVLLLTGSIQGTRDNVEKFLQSFSCFEWLWLADADAIYKDFMKRNPMIDDYERELAKFAQVEESINSIHLIHNMGALALNTATIKEQLRGLNSQWKVQYSDNLHKTASSKLAELSGYFKSTLTKLNREPDSLDSIKYLMDVLVEIRDREASIDLSINPILDMYSLLEAFLPEGGMPKEEQDMRAMLRVNWMKLRDRGEYVTEQIAQLQGDFRRKLLADVKAFKLDVASFRQDFLKNGPMVKGIPPAEAQDRLRRFQEEFDIRARKRELYCNGESLFALPRTDYPELDETKKELDLLDKLYALYRDVMARMEEWRVILWPDVVANIEFMSTEIESFSGRCKKMPKRLREWEAYSALKTQIEDFQTILPLLQELSKDSIRPRHWENLEKIMSMTDLNPTVDPDFRLQQLLDAPLLQFREDIEEITDGADKELSIQTKLGEIEEKWSQARFTFASWKSRNVPVLQGVGLVLEELEESAMVLQTLNSMKHKAVFTEQLAAKLNELTETTDWLEKLQKVQTLWCSLESVFLGGDIAKQMPTVAKIFQKIDKDFSAIMNKAMEQSFVTVCMANEVLQLTLPAMQQELESCQKALEGYLEQKRNKFPRFYFVSNPVLLQILSQGSDPLAVQQYYEKIFDSISAVEHDEKNKFIINAMLSREGSTTEEVVFRKPVEAMGNIEDWLMKLLKEMQRTMKIELSEAAAAVSVAWADTTHVASASQTNKRLEQFVGVPEKDAAPGGNKGVCGQYALLGIQLMWTADVEHALMVVKKEKNAMRHVDQKTLNILNIMADWCRGELGSKLTRTKVETLVTIHVHQRDVVSALLKLYNEGLLKSADDFEWLKQARFYWDPDARDFIDENGACRIRITDVVFDYQYEYLGCKERLVITPLTDRCYITLAQAINMYFGGAPAGPAGTGKTETTKDMGRALGIFVVVTNCTDQMRYTDCAKIFKGLCQAGLWGCFDEFNRITLPVLSVVAQQVLAITNAKKAGVEYFQFPGDPQQVLLNPVCGAFITMNPGYAGRQELPENLKALFRGVAMMVPDRQIIMKVKLCSVGYRYYEILAQKFFVCYALCEQQLSKQKHYDFGLRNILSVLRTAGATLRDSKDTPIRVRPNLSNDPSNHPKCLEEQALLYRTLRDMNLSKFVAQDVGLFKAMLKDLFPVFLEPPGAKRYPAIESAIATAVADAKLIAHRTWITKVIQLYETQLVRHGIMLTGPTGGGKTRIMETLKTAKEAAEGRAVRIVRMNPKAIQAHEMYGQADLSGEWIRGVFAAIWEKYNNRDLPYITWIVQDGPVDAIWIEDLNTVLDDNKILTLASGDRIPMTDNVKIMFENESLANASPATVSRAGIIYVSETDLDWAPVALAWIKRQPLDSQVHLRELIDKLIGPCVADDAPPTKESEKGGDDDKPKEFGHLFNFLIRDCNPIMSQQRVGMVASFYHLVQAMLARYGPSMPTPSADPERYRTLLERIMCFSITWTIAGQLEQEDRVKYDAYMRTVAPSSMPICEAGETIYEYTLDPKSLEWGRWRPPAWSYPEGEHLNFSNLLVPTMDSTRTIFLLEMLHEAQRPVLLLGGPGTAKTSNALMFFAKFDPSKRMLKRINFSSATTPGMFQSSIESELDKRGGKSYGPPGGKFMTVFIDDISMPTINTWGDQPTNEIVRQLIEMGGMYFLDKDKRGDFKQCEALQYVAAMTHPGGGRNDIPNRLKRQFFSFNLVLPALASIDDLYGLMLKGRFPSAEFNADALSVVEKLTTATIELWRKVKAKMLPTPAKFHYVFNMRELSRVFQGVLLTPKSTILTGGQQTPNTNQGLNLLRLWKHECARVFCDKLVSNADKEWYDETMDLVIESTYGPAIADACKEEYFYVDFFREDEIDEETDCVINAAPKIYEPGGTLENIRNRVRMFMDRHNEQFPSKKLELVLFEDALRHLIRISRLLGMPRASALLVGVGGSGKQSLTRLAAYIAGSQLRKIALAKGYKISNFETDLLELYEIAGHQRKSCTFLFTDSDIKDENFLEYINSMLMTGEVAGLIPKDKMLGWVADLQSDFVKERPGEMDTPDNLRQFFRDCAWDNLHIVLCMSPVNAKFAERARKFPGLISGTTIDWFLPWPEEALIAVSRGFMSNFPVEADDVAKEALIVHMGLVHSMVMDVCTEYYNATRRSVYQTPKSYLSFISNYQTIYRDKLADLQYKESNINTGLEKLIQGAADVEAMKEVLAQEQVKLNKATEDTNRLLAQLQVQQAEAEQESAKVAEIKMACMAEAERIALERQAAQSDLDAAMPIVRAAEEAAKSIQPADVNFVCRLAKPADIVRMVLDVVLILFMRPMPPPVLGPFRSMGTECEWIVPNWSEALQVMSDSKFLFNLVNFDRDALNEETIELCKPYTEFDTFFKPKVAKTGAAASEGMCTWAIAMGDYFYASRFVKPKLEALTLAEASLVVAKKALSDAEAREQQVLDMLAQLKATFDAQISEKIRLEDNAAMLQRKLDQASALINGLAGERMRWGEDSKMFAETKRRLLGDCAVACAFLSYCGPFNQQYRQYLLNEKFTADCRKRGVPVTKDLDVVAFLDQGNIGDWNLQGLPTDPLSVQNGILVTRASRYPLLIDPQGQALAWLRNKEAGRFHRNEVTLALSSPKLRDVLVASMESGNALIITGVEEELDPMLDPVLEKSYITRGRTKFVLMGEGEKALDEGDPARGRPGFSMYFITRLPNPHFSPELQAKTTVVDFTVTIKGLEEQLLGRVIAREQNALEKLLNQVLAEVVNNTKALQALDSELLERLSSNSGSLLDDEGLVGQLAQMKATAAEVKEKLAAADETRRSINEKREQFRPVATRGSVLYFSIVEMSLVNCMYQTSLAQFIELFQKSMEVADKAALAVKRVSNIIESQTYLVYRYINKGLYERDKLLFVFILATKILVTANLLDPAEISLFLRGGAALDLANVRRKPTWMSAEAWLNVIALSDAVPFFKSLPELIFRQGLEAQWKRWYEDNEPERLPIPELEAQLKENKEIGPWRRLLLVRALRMDRTLLCVRHFVRDCEGLGEKYIEPVTDTIEMIYEDMVPATPVVFLLSIGADPTENIEQLAKRKKQVVQCVSLGEGQEPVAIRAMNAAAMNGSWVLLQNCELGLDLMDKMEELIASMKETMHPDYRLFITALPHPKFPLGLLQMSTKITNEPPAGLRAGLLRSYSVIVDQDRLERIDSVEWRQLVYALCFLHSVAQERRKFGPLGWCIPYEYGPGDLQACLLFVEKHLYSGPISWPTVQYMVAEAQYGGKITDGMDRRLFNAYAEEWISARALEYGFTFNPEKLLAGGAGFQYNIPDTLQDVDAYRKYISTFPDIDSPEVFGLHPNASTTFLVKEVNSLLTTMSETQPKQSASLGGKSMDEIVKEKAIELLGALPDDYVEEQYMWKIEKMGSKEPLNVFLMQEIQRLQAVISRVRDMLSNMVAAINGEVVMTAELLAAMTDVYDARVPKPWLYTPGGDEFSWLLPYLGTWFAGLKEREAQLSSWLNNGRPTSFWMTGFANPQGFLTAMKQMVTQNHKGGGSGIPIKGEDTSLWALDDVDYWTTVKNEERPEQAKPEAEGVLVHGLFIDGARWDKANATLAESEPKKLFAPLPILHVTVVKSSTLRAKLSNPAEPLYEAPCYRYPARNDRYRIFQIYLPSKNNSSRHWILRGVAVLCITA